MVPDAPENLTATAGDGEVTLAWEAPGSDGGAEITSYEYRYSAGTTVITTAAWTDAGAVKGETVSSLTNGTGYAFEVRAVNTAGGGAAASATATPVAAAVCTVDTSGRTEIWTGTVTVGQLGFFLDYGYRSANLGGLVGGLSDTEFDIGTDSYTIEAVFVEYDGDFVFVTDNLFPTADLDRLTLHVCDSTFDLDDAVLTLGRYESRNSGLDWSSATTVNLALSEEAATNTAPVITTTSPQSVAENTTAVATLAATDAEGDSLTWSKNGGADAGKFDLTDAGVLTFAAAPSFESPTDSDTDNGYEVTLRVSDGTATADLSLLVNVTDVEEKPDRPSAPMVDPTSGSHTSLDVSWTEPGLNGGPAINVYKLRYRQGTGGGWSDGPQNVSGTSSAIASLTAGTAHQVQVKALNGETPSEWSASGSGSTSSATNTAPTFDDGASATRAVNENTAAGQNVGTAVGATDADSDALTYTLSGTDMSSFDIVSTSGQIQTKDALDHESKSSYSLTVSVSDGNGGTADIGVTVNVGDRNEKPDTPAAPSVVATPGSNTSLDVSWTKPGLNGGPSIYGYNLRYRQGTGGGWTNGPQNVSGLSSAIASLTAGTAYQVQVKARNGEAPSDWSPSGGGSTSSATNTAPVITTTSPQSVAENTTAVATLAAADAENDDLTWSKNGGADAAKFNVTDAGVLTFATAPNFESPTDNGADNGYVVTLRVSDGTATADLSLTVDVTDVNEKPDRPSAPSVVATANSSTSLDVSWTAPGLNGGPAISGYHLRYREGTSGDWTGPAYADPGLPEIAITGLTAGTAHQVQVRALNGETPSDWSTSGSGSTSSGTVESLGQPRSLDAAGGDGRVILSWRAPSSDGGSAIVRYERRYKSSGSYNGWSTVSGGGGARGETVTGLANGTRYTFQVRAVNGDGDGPEAQASARPQSFGRPSLDAEGGNRRVILSWGAPSSSGGSAIIRYERRYKSSGSYNGWSTVSGGGAARGETVTGLANGTRYTFQVRAVNGDGPGPEAEASATPNARTLPAVSVSDAAANEGDRLAFSVTLDRASDQPVVVDWTTRNGTAAAGTDYTAGSGKVVFAPNETERTVHIATLEDNADDDGETMTLALSNPNGAALGDATATGTIRDNGRDPAKVSVHDTETVEGAGAVLSFPVRLDRAAASTVTVEWETNDGSAKAGKDYVAASGTTTFPTGQTEKTVAVKVLDDTDDEGDEVMVLMITSATGAHMGDRVAKGTIKDNDASSSASGDQAQGAGPRQAGPEEALALVAGLSPREAAAALFGEVELDSARLRAGRSPSLRTADRVLDFMAAYERDPRAKRIPARPRRNRRSSSRARRTPGSRATTEQPADPQASPPTRVLRLPEVQDRTGLSRTTIYAWMAEGRFPRPIPLGARAVGWIEAEVDAWDPRADRREAGPATAARSGARLRIERVRSMSSGNRRVARDTLDRGDAAFRRIVTGGSPEPRWGCSTKPLAAAPDGFPTVSNVFERYRSLGHFPQVDALADGSSAFRHEDAGAAVRCPGERVPAAHGPEADDLRNEGVGRPESDAPDRPRTLPVAEDGGPGPGIHGRARRGLARRASPAQPPSIPEAFVTSEENEEEQSDDRTID